MGGSITSEDIKELEQSLLHKKNIKNYKKCYKDCKHCLDCIPSFFLTVKYYYNGLFYE